MNFVILIVFAFVIVTAEDTSKNAKKAKEELPACSACSTLVRSFEAAEQKAESFDEAMNKVCLDVDRGKEQCRKNVGLWRPQLEEWTNLEKDDGELRSWLCVDKLEVCCPEGFFGPGCSPCLYKDEDAICSGNGRCKGSGTRKGNGRCTCDAGYSGETCSSCAEGFYVSFQDDRNLLCSPCHKSCKSHCSGPGAKACAACAAGWRMDTEHGCSDLDECAESRPCAGNKFCVNTEGAFECVRCDRACDGCRGDGPDSCIKCAEGYLKNKEGTACISEETAGRILNLSNTRFFTYAGLCIATCIIFQRSVAVASTLGVVVAVYISLAEYYLQGATGELKPIESFD